MFACISSRRCRSRVSRDRRSATLPCRMGPSTARRCRRTTCCRRALSFSRRVAPAEVVRVDHPVAVSRNSRAAAFRGVVRQAVCRSPSSPHQPLRHLHRPRRPPHPLNRFPRKRVFPPRLPRKARGRLRRSPALRLRATRPRPACRHPCLRRRPFRHPLLDRRPRHRSRGTRCHRLPMLSDKHRPRMPRVLRRKARRGSQGRRPVASESYPRESQFPPASLHHQRSKGSHRQSAARRPRVSHCNGRTLPRSERPERPPVRHRRRHHERAPGISNRPPRRRAHRPLRRVLHRL